MGIAGFYDPLIFSGGARLHCTTTNLTDTQIKALPSWASSHVTISETPAAGTLIWPISIELKINAGFGAYTNIDADAFLWAGSAIAGSSPFTIALQAGYVANDATLTPAATGMDDLFGSAFTNGCLVFPLQRSDASVINDWWQLAHVVSAYNDYYAMPWSIAVDNGSSGDFTGGHASNTGTVKFVYLIA